MLQNLLTSLATVALFMLPLLPVVALHELGHLAIAELMGLRQHQIVIGSPVARRLLLFTWGRLSIYVALNLTTFLGIGYYQGNLPSLRPMRRLLVVLGGPLASLLSALLVLALPGQVGWVNAARYLFAAWSIYAGLGSLWPQRYPPTAWLPIDLKSDGLQVLEALKEAQKPKARQG